VVAGVGGSATGGDYLAALVSTTSAIPVHVCRSLRLPAFVDAGTAVICCSHSGDTEETLACYDQARARGATLYAIRSGGELDRRARAQDIPGAVLSNHVPPRAALGQALGALLRAGEALRLFEWVDVRSAGLAHRVLVDQRLGPSVPTYDNPAKTLAGALRGRLVLVLAAEHLVAAADRFKNQLAENGKAFAATLSLPEAAHNTVVGLENALAHSDHLSLVTLESTWHHDPRLHHRFDLITTMFDAAGIPVHRIALAGESRLADLLEATAWADFVSCYVGLLNGFDPTPISPIAQIRAALADRADRA